MPLIDNSIPQTEVQLAQVRRQELFTKTQFLLTSPDAQFQIHLAAWEKGMSLLWDDPKPEEILAKLGDKAATLFDISAKAAVYFESLVSGSTKSALAKVKPYKINLDGTVTLA